MLPEAFGARIVVQDIAPTDEVTERAKASGLYVVIEERNRPKATTGTIVALGNDPCLREVFELNLGDVISFNSYAGQKVCVEGVEYRILDVKEMTTRLQRAAPESL